jgi:hypothetical protein
MRDSTLPTENSSRPIESEWEGCADKWSTHFLAWLRSVDWSPEQILRWMEGLDVPAEDVQTEPHLWVLRAVEGWPRRGYSGTLAYRVSAVIDYVGADRFTELTPRIIYNVLCLCTGLNRSHELCGALDNLLQSAELRRIQYRAVPLATTLRSALMWNQADDRWSQYWYAMMRSRADPRLPGFPMDGFDAILIGWPRQHPEEVGCALAEIAHWIESDVADPDERASAFRAVIEKAEKRRRSDMLSLDSLSGARRHAIPDWAFPLLPAAVRIVSEKAASRNVDRTRLMRRFVADVTASGFQKGESIAGLADHRSRHMAGEVAVAK